MFMNFINKFVTYMYIYIYIYIFVVINLYIFYSSGGWLHLHDDVFTYTVQYMFAMGWMNGPRNYTATMF